MKSFCSAKRLHSYCIFLQKRCTDIVGYVVRSSDSDIAFVLSNVKEYLESGCAKTFLIGAVLAK